jgi:LysR family hydrogen peroxide-inducible transcriptional activator
VQLIERQPRRVSLTAAGEAVVARARRMLESSEEIVTLARTLHDPLTGQLRLALLPTVGPYLLPLVALKIRRALPRLELMLYEYRTESMLERLQKGDIDVGVLALPVHAEGLAVRALYQEPFLLAVPAAHKLAARARVQVNDLDGETLLLLEDGHCLRDQALAVCRRVDIHEKQNFRATSIETLRQMVATGAGITLLPTLATRGAYGGARGVVLRPFAKPVPSRQIGAVWRKSSARTAAINAVCDLLARYSSLT